tara:strand:+ start:908 stop:2140 length:1233 start_codon:yes stop_codon:yes gene_type:complete
MKALKSILLLLVTSFSLLSCGDDDYNLQPEIAQTGSLESPASDETIDINPESDDRIIFSWSPAQAVDGGTILYKIKFDEAGGDFEDPLFVAPSDNGGGATSYTMSASRLNVIAAEAGIQQLETGDVQWTVEATSSFYRQNFTESSTLRLKRPEGLAIFPEYMYIYGSATEVSEISEGVAFKQISNQLSTDNIQPGIFESITKLTPGEFYIANDNNASADGISYYYVNSEGKIRSGENPTAFNMDEGVYRVRMDLAKATISFTEISNIELYIIANQITKAELNYIGNHTFEAVNAYFDFLVPGAPESPDWLGWEEERYRFKFQLGDDQTSYIGSFHDEAMNGSLVAGLDAYNARPNGGEPDYYYNSYFLGTEAGYWQGAWKFPDQLNGANFTVRVVFDPKADNYYHELIKE